MLQRGLLWSPSYNIGGGGGLKISSEQIPEQSRRLGFVFALRSTWLIQQVQPLCLLRATSAELIGSRS